MSEQLTAVPPLAEQPARSRAGPRRRAVTIALAPLVAVGACWFGWQAYARSVRHRAQLHAARAAERFEAGDAEGALREYRAAARLDPGSGRAWYLVGRTE